VGKVAVKREDLIYPELSYQIVGCAFDVFRQLGSGHLEVHYQRGLKVIFDKNNIPHKEQEPFEIKLENKVIGKAILDFIVDEKIIVEIKKSDKFSEANINQVFNYLKSTGLKLGIIINFGKNEVKFRRVVNIKD